VGRGQGLEKKSVKISEFEEGMGQHTFIPKEVVVFVMKNWHPVKIMSSPAIKEFGFKKKKAFKSNPKPG